MISLIDTGNLNTNIVIFFAIHINQRSSANNRHCPATEEGYISSEPLQGELRPAELLVPESLCLLLSGNGKGKTTSAIGMAVRGSSMGWRVAVLQFVKSGDWKSGEEEACRRLGIEFKSLGSGFTWDSSDFEQDKKQAQIAWNEAAEVISAGSHQIVILNELTMYISKLLMLDCSRMKFHYRCAMSGFEMDQETSAMDLQCSHKMFLMPLKLVCKLPSG